MDQMGNGWASSYQISSFVSIVEIMIKCRQGTRGRGWGEKQERTLNGFIFLAQNQQFQGNDKSATPTPVFNC